MKIAIGCDEAGCGLKHIIIDLLQKEGIEVTDEGCRDDEVVLYPNIAERVANIVADGEADRGILICGTGIGMAMAANKVKGIRAAVCHDPFSTERSRKSNDAQIMCMGARVIGPELAKMLVKLWLTCDFAGGGSGHKPAFIGYVGRNMVDAVAVGEIFSSPTAVAFYDAIRAADHGNGVACLYGNYAGDNMNVKMAMEMAEDDDIEVKIVVANDDVASAPKENREKRRGVAGEIFMWKCAGAKAAMGGTLDEVIAAAQKAIDNCHSVGVGLSPCSLPAAGKPNFQIEEGTAEFGIGHHGEPGVEVCRLGTAKEIAEKMTKLVMDDISDKGNGELAVLVSGLGSTPVMELYVLYQEVEKILESNGFKVVFPLVGNYFTSLDMKGATVTLCQVDDEMREYLNMEIDTVAWKQFQK